MRIDRGLEEYEVLTDRSTAEEKRSEAGLGAGPNDLSLSALYTAMNLDSLQRS